MTFINGPRGTALDDLHQYGCSKVRFPRHDGAHLQAVLLNTAGGLTDGDELVTSVEWREHTRAVVTSQAAERIYRSRGGDARIETALTVGKEATALWLPQETILFDGARLDRSTSISLCESSRLIVIESLVFGRHAMRETVRAGSITEAWRIELDGKLVFADRLRISDDDAPLDSTLSDIACANGHAALATMIYAASDCGDYVDGVRSAIAGQRIAGGVSCLGPLLNIRLLAPSGQALREGIVTLFAALTGDTPQTLPRVWQI